jgi:hypothetical protein
MGVYICSKKEKNTGLITGSLIIGAGVTTVTVSSILLAKSNKNADKSPDAPVPSNSSASLIFVGGLITYVGLVLVPLYATSKNE